MRMQASLALRGRRGSGSAARRVRGTLAPSSMPGCVELVSWPRHHLHSPTVFSVQGVSCSLCFQPLLLNGLLEHGVRPNFRLEEPTPVSLYPLERVLELESEYD